MSRAQRASTYEKSGIAGVIVAYMADRNNPDRVAVPNENRALYYQKKLKSSC